MLCLKLAWVSDSHTRHALLLAMAMTTGSCGLFPLHGDQASPVNNLVTENESESARLDIVIVGVSRLSGLIVSIDNNQIVGALIKQLATQHALLSAPPSVTRNLTGAGPHDAMMAHYSRHGQLAAHQIQRLMDSDLPAPIAMLVRLESDSVEKLPLVASDILLPQSSSNSQSVRISYTTRRITSLSVKMFDLRNGREIQNRLYVRNIDRQSTNLYSIGSASLRQDADGMENVIFDVTNEALYPQPATLADSIVGLLEQAVNDLSVSL